MDAVADLSAIHEQVLGCTACALSATRTNAVPGEGPVNARVMFVGEGPGFNEDRQGRPFIGAAGQFLNELLASIGLRREDVFITNMVKCRPPNNRDPFPVEISTCSSYLDAQIETISPDVIIPLGRHALSRWFPNETISKLKAKPRRFGSQVVLPLYHPAAALHNGSLRSVIMDDFQRVRALLDEAYQVPTVHEAEPSEQVSLLEQTAVAAPAVPASANPRVAAPAKPDESAATGADRPTSARSPRAMGN